ncbi:phage terminase large subunit (plasmid) [Leptospira interrogans]|uniref:phage terminase large subunit n=1 Tax=Leptospira interrogans TaxID=173 RepID=UPI0002BD44AF|nr:phage terminase large subunit [Leptospira interrogans]EMN60305.1 hypothetical protein LEP1GSC092_0037 [Leptospira interrogans serovar Pyrogenes str. R168]ULG90663.1 phage terminase large subunit [Leptospira interrogans]ULG90692.1 phage terminase large subunit [Leptospira interrogans]UML78408.1 phage terminase large subunit [Leptospira interrogans]UML78464.1 phage terminase large subunit [Leptospira interrogans]
MAISSILKTPLELKAKIALELKRRAKEKATERKLTFREWLVIYAPHFKFYKHTEILIAQLQRVADGNLKRLMIFMPPRHGKSELVSRLFPAYVQYYQSGWNIGLCSYSASLAFTFGRIARDYFLKSGGETVTKKKDHWTAYHGGEMWSAGVDGSITGKGFRIGIIDDPLKNWKEAKSPTIRQAIIDWYLTTFYTRAEPDAALIVCMTRWSLYDLAGWMLEEESGEDFEKENWHIVNFEALKTNLHFAFPKSCSIEPDWRAEGEALCPERYPVASLNRIRRRLGTFYFSALYQQHPIAGDGGIIKRDWIQEWTELPPGKQTIIQTWDLTFDDTENSNFVVGAVWCKIGRGCYLLDRVRKQMDVIATRNAIIEMKQKWPLTTKIYIEKKANGAAVLTMLRNEIPGIVPYEPGSNSKEDRGRAVSPVFEDMRVWIPFFASWKDEWIREHTEFPFGKHDDQVDTTTMALEKLEGTLAGGVSLNLGNAWSKKTR